MGLTVCALLAWYAEPPGMLKEMVASIARAGVTDLAALDGAYGLLPDGAPASPKSNLAALERACDKHHVRLWHAAPDRVWPDEMTKRSCLFELGDRAGADWFMVIDADEIVTHGHVDSLNEVREDAATVELRAPGEPVLDDFRMFFRAVPGIRVVGNHYTYVTPDGRKLWAAWNEPREPAGTTDLRVFHKTGKRGARRRAQRDGYYQARDYTGVERGLCECGARATTHGIVPAAKGGELVGRWVEACEVCAAVMGRRFRALTRDAKLRVANAA